MLKSHVVSAFFDTNGGISPAAVTAIGIAVISFNAADSRKLITIIGMKEYAQLTE